VSAAALYARVSTEDQAERYGLGVQLTALRALAAQRGDDVAAGAEFVDDGASGATLDRPALTRLRAAVRDRAVQAVLIYDPDRLSRSLAHLLLLMDEFKRAGAELVYVTTPRVDSPEGRLLEHVKGVVAEFEREKIRERTVRGRWEKARRGLRVASRAPYGYRLDPAQPGGILVFEPAAAIVRRIFGWLVDEGASIRGITARLRRDGVPAPQGRKWEPSTVARILTNPTYQGKWPYGRVARVGTTGTRRPPDAWVMVPVPAVLTPERFEAAQVRLAGNRVRLGGRPSTTPALLRGFVRCGVCGRRMHQWRATRGPRRYRYYRCAGGDGSRTPPDARCAHATPAAPLETAVWGAVRGVLARPDLLAGRVAAARVRLGVRDVEIRSELEHLRRQRTQLGRATQRLLDLLLDEALPHAEIRAKLVALEAQRAQLDVALQAAQARIQAQANAEARLTAVRAFCATLGPRLDVLGATPAGRRTVFDRCMEAVCVHPEGRVDVQMALPLTPLPDELGPELSMTTPSRPRGSWAGAGHRIPAR
jgi:site-specific DNA recombinase